MNNLLIGLAKHSTYNIVLLSYKPRQLHLTLIQKRIISQSMGKQTLERENRISKK